MSNSSLLQQRFGERLPLAELEAHFRALDAGAYEDCGNAGTTLFSLQESLKLTDEFQSFHPLFQAEEMLQLLILGTNNQSDYYCYALDFPCPGAIVFLAHDDTTQIVFPQLRDMIAAARQASLEDGFLDAAHQPGVYLSPDQALLNERLRQGYEAGRVEPVCLLLRSSDLSDTALLSKIAADRNF
jgi:hypothetical protein